MQLDETLAATSWWTERNVFHEAGQDLLVNGELTNVIKEGSDVVNGSVASFDNPVWDVVLL